jgi:small basic protein (TIGR04137 family)
MSLHRSLKTQSGALNQHRNVLTRAERIARLTTEDRFDPAKNTALGIVKVRSIKASAGKKPKKAEEAAEGAAGAKPAAGAKAAAGAAAKPAAGAAKPAAGAKK